MTIVQLESILIDAYTRYVTHAGPKGRKRALLAAHTLILERFEDETRGDTAEHLYALAEEAGISTFSLESTKSALLSYVLRTFNNAAATTNVAA